jgi:hypothetical protein
MLRRRYLLFGMSVMVVLYFGLTWFFFGSTHPCGILEARWKPYRIEVAEQNQRNAIDEQKKIAGSSEQEFPADAFRSMVEGRVTNRDRLALGTYQDAQRNQAKAWNEAAKLVKDLRSIPQEEAERVHQDVWRLTPGECLWRVITWRRPATETTSTVY